MWHRRVLNSLRVSPSGKENGAREPRPFLISNALTRCALALLSARSSRSLGQSWAVGSTAPGSQWHDLNDRYLGLKFAIKGKTPSGWARFERTKRSPASQLSLEGRRDQRWKPSSLALLVLGSPLLSIWRQEETLDTTQ